MTKGWPVRRPPSWGCSLASGTPPPRPLFHSPLLAPRRSVVVSPACCASEGGRASTRSCPSSDGSRRRLVLLTGSSIALSAFPTLLITTSASLAAAPLSAVEAQEAEKEELLELYTDKEEGFTLLRPSSWPKVDKAGATVLFEGDGNKSNTIGVVVNPVRLSSLKDFGTPEFVAEKLIQAERHKESTKDAQMVRVAERVGHGGLPVYEFEYTVDSTRGGLKRIFSAAFVDAKKLHLLNISHSDSSASPLDSKTRKILEKVLHSFDAV